MTRGTSRYVSQLVSDILSEEQRRELGLAYRKLRHQFSNEDGVETINRHLEAEGNPATEKKLTIQVDLSSRSNWDSAIGPHLDDLPFDCAGKGEACRIQTRLAIADTAASSVILLEEPENHLSHSNLNALIDDIGLDCEDRQVIVTTHSTFVMNKLGLANLKLLSHAGRIGSIEGLGEETVEYFKKLPGYDTLRFILAKASILVEGPSDELIVQRVYQKRHGRLPLADGVDVISVGLAFKRFLEIAKILELDVRVVTDNDGSVVALKNKYSDYLDSGTSSISICFDEDESCPTLEPQLLKANSRDVLNEALGTEFSTDDELIGYMTSSKNKTHCALKLFETEVAWSAPEYIVNAINP